ncbi:MAG: LLM class flavin-dependent oxidoreductase [Acidimicrobiales bacterium]
MTVKVGICLPQFRDEAEPSIRVALQAEAVGLDGVFAFDHLWPLGRPDRPALHGQSLLGALAAETERVTLGTLVARVGLVPDASLVHTLTSLARIAGGRFVAGLGTGDKANRAENEAYGVPFARAAERLDAVVRCVRDLRGRGVTAWVGGLSLETRMVAAREADGWNGWGLTVDAFAELAADQPAPTWAGQVLIGRDEAEAQAKFREHGDRPGLVHGTPETLAAHFAALEVAGARWAICAPLDVGTDESVPDLVAAAAMAAR